MRPLPTRMQDTIYHDMTFPKETLEIRGKIRDFAEKEIAPLAYSIGQQEESKENFSYAVFRKLAEADFFKIPFPREIGELGLVYRTCATAVIIEELSYISNSIAAIYDVHCILTGNALMNGSNLIKQKYLKPMAVGEKIGCFATTEPDASSELSSQVLKTAAEKKGDKYVVNGHKRFITNAPVAERVIQIENARNLYSK
jgi:butyryl-CoA dehydrogenase